MTKTEFIYGIGILPKDRDSFLMVKEHLIKKGEDFQSCNEHSLGFLYMVVLENHTRKFVISMPNFDYITVQNGIIPVIKGQDLIEISSENDIITLDKILEKRELL